jgi:hypothetical protein
MIADEQAVEPGFTSRRRPLDHPSGAEAHVVDDERSSQ